MRAEGGRRALFWLSNVIPEGQAISLAVSSAILRADLGPSRPRSHSKDVTGCACACACACVRAPTRPAAHCGNPKACATATVLQAPIDGDGVLVHRATLDGVGSWAPTHNNNMYWLCCVTRQLHKPFCVCYFLQQLITRVCLTRDSNISWCLRA